VLDLFLFCVSFFSLMGATGGSTFSISNWSNCMVNLKNRSCVSIELCPTSTHCNCHLELHTPQGDFICRQVNERNKLPITTKSSLSAITTTTTTTTQKIPSFCWNLPSSIYLQDSYALNKLANWFLLHPYTHSWWSSFLFQKWVFWFWWMKKVLSRKFYRKKFLNFAGFWWCWLKKSVYDLFGWVGGCVFWLFISCVQFHRCHSYCDGIVPCCMGSKSCNTCGRIAPRNSRWWWWCCNNYESNITQSQGAIDS